MPSGASFSLLHTFSGADGLNPRKIMLATDGNFYGTTVNGGASGAGTVFRMTPGGVVTVLHSFAGNGSEGRNPYGALIQATDGAFYGTTYLGGTNNGGTALSHVGRNLHGAAHLHGG
jgi:uncharacterized repeat protein (TIGR03803 family)